MSRALHAGFVGCLLLWAIPQVHAQIKVKYICGKGRYWISRNGGEPHYCFDGVHYSKSTGGVPAFVLDYWANSERNREVFREKMKRSREESKGRMEAQEAEVDQYRRAHGMPSVAESQRKSAEAHQAALERYQAHRGPPQQTRTTGASAYASASATPAVERSTKPTVQPVSRALFSGLSTGADKTAIVEALGQPHGALRNLGSEGDEESLTYLVEGGGQAKIRLKQGKVLFVQLP